jgi:Tfp pilus assembly protein PilZ
VEDKSILSKSLMSTLVELADISTTGAGVTAYERLELEGQNFIRLNSFNELFLECNIVWRNPSITIKNAHGMIVPSFKTGLQFKDLSPDKSILLEDFLRLFHVPDIKKASSAYKPRAPRFKIESSEKAVLYYLRISMVKKISLGGMLIKTTSAFFPGKEMTLALFIAREDLPIELHGRVTSIIPVCTNGDQFFNIGIEFLNIQRRDQTRLSRFIHYLSLAA